MFLRFKVFFLRLCLYIEAHACVFICLFRISTPTMRQQTKNLRPVMSQIHSVDLPRSRAQLCVHSSVPPWRIVYVWPLATNAVRFLKNPAAALIRRFT